MEFSTLIIQCNLRPRQSIASRHHSYLPKWAKGEANKEGSQPRNEDELHPYLKHSLNMHAATKVGQLDPIILFAASAK